VPPIAIRLARTQEDYAGCEELSRSIWGAAERNVVPRELLLTMQLNGGIVQGAWLPDGTIVGFVFGFLGERDGRRRLCSHQLGVLPAYRGTGLGVRLKLAQAEEARRRGLELITWTFDPLEARNAYINLHRLGGVAWRYDRDHYGVMDDDLNRGLATDRFEAEWWLMKPRSVPAVDQPIVMLGVGRDGHPRRIDVDVREASSALIAVPTDFQAIKLQSMELARLWRTETRAAFEAALAAGLIAVDFQRDGVYVMQRRALED
jgi:predicted GNAT superfamily acetyltransferase